jgi:hypothetical protein
MKTGLDFLRVLRFPLPNFFITPTAPYLLIILSCELCSSDMTVSLSNKLTFTHSTVLYLFNKISEETRRPKQGQILQNRRKKEEIQMGFPSGQKLIN